jgi:hypothetical protein
MINIIKSKLNNKYRNNPVKGKEIIKYYKDFSPAVRQWKDSIYLYNKNTLSLIPEANKIAMKLIQGYFNLFNFKLEKKLRNKRLKLRLRKISINKIFVSGGEFKHTNDKINITLYLFNRQKNNYLLKIKKRFFNLFKNLRFKQKLLLIRKKGLRIINLELNNKVILLKALRFNNKISKTYIKQYQDIYYRLFIRKSLKRLKLYMYYKQLLYINKSKFNNFYLQGLINLIEKIYKKNVVFNLVNLKYFYLNSDIMTQTLLLKLRKNRKNLLRYLNRCVTKAKTGNIEINSMARHLNILKLEGTDNLCNKLFQLNKTKSKYLNDVVLNNIKYKKVTGIRLEAAGRLTKRYTASRSLFKVRYKGNLINAYSSINKYPSTLLRGKFRPNLQYTKLNSKSRIGSFGLKGWVSSI